MFQDAITFDLKYFQLKKTLFSFYEFLNYLINDIKCKKVYFQLKNELFKLQ